MEKRLELFELARKIDISAVRTDVTLQELSDLAETAKRYHFICAFTMPCFTPQLAELIRDTPDVALGGVVGFPSGAETTQTKVHIARELLSMGCGELDMVINVGALKSGYYDLVERDIRSVVEAADGKPVKSILEICYLTDDEIRRASEIAVRAGVTYVKTGTGWGPRPTTVETIRLIRSTIGDAAKIKAAGGVRGLDTLLAMIDAGCDRFGISAASCRKIMQEAAARLEAKNLVS